MRIGSTFLVGDIICIKRPLPLCKSRPQTTCEDGENHSDLKISLPLVNFPHFRKSKREHFDSGLQYKG